MIKKQLSIIICLSFLFAPVWAAQTDWANGNSGAVVRAALQANDTELYAFIDNNIIGTDTQAWDADLDIYAGITPSANIQTFLGAADYTAMITQLSLTIGTNTQAWDAFLDDIGALTDPGADRLLFWDDSGTLIDFLILGTNLSITDKTINATGSGGTTVDAIGDAAAAGAVDFVTYDQLWDMGTGSLQLGDGATNYVKVDVTGEVSFGGTGGLTGNIVSEYITFTPSATPPATTDGLLRNTTGYTGLGSDTFSFWDGSVIQYLLNYDTLPTINGSMPTYNSANNDFDWTVPAGSTVASSAEVNTGTDNAKFISPDALAGSNAFTKEVAWIIYDSTTDTAVADGLQFFIVPTSYNGMNLVEIIASVETAGTTGTTDIQIRRVRGATAVDMLSTIATIDTGERDTTTAATPYVINAANDDLTTADRIFIDLDAISTTAAKGLSVTALFRLP